MDIIERLALKLITNRVPHQRERIGVKPSSAGTYVRFNYQCKDDCPRCALDKLLGEKQY
jgi:hypothetical protein